MIVGYDCSDIYLPPRSELNKLDITCCTNLHWQRSSEYLMQILIIVKWHNSYGVHKIQVSLRCCAREVSLVLKYGATNVEPTQKDQPLLSSKRRPNFHTHKCCWKEQNLVTGPDGARNQERLCWRGPAAIYCNAMLCLPSRCLATGVGWDTHTQTESDLMSLLLFFKLRLKISAKSLHMLSRMRLAWSTFPCKRNRLLLRISLLVTEYRTAISVPPVEQGSTKSIFRLWAPSECVLLLLLLLLFREINDRNWA
jgi:hypothetical protein